ncbi:hypothetical protein [uncultured Methylobacterium sp.]|uniref:hypothetical protein n=1 Tax=uncultured Methylobacterium sp. TaxID=157278 RepID=UPI0035C9DEBF
MNATCATYGHLAAVPICDDGARSAIADFLHALDRGDFGDLRIGPPQDRSESAFIAALRQQIEAVTDRSVMAQAHRRGAALADDLYGERRPRSVIGHLQDAAALCRKGLSAHGIRPPIRSGEGVLRGLADADGRLFAVLIPTGSAATDHALADAIAAAINAACGSASVAHPIAAE